MPIEFNCAFCGKHYRVAETSAAKRVKCKGCDALITIPRKTPSTAADTVKVRKQQNAKTEIISPPRHHKPGS